MEFLRSNSNKVKSCSKLEHILKDTWVSEKPNSYIYTCVRPYIRAMQYCGLYRISYSCRKDNKNQQNKRKIMENISFIYCVLVSVLLVSNILRTVLIFSQEHLLEINGLWELSIAIIGWYILNSLNACGMLYLSSKRQSLPEALEQLDTLCLKTLGELNIQPNLFLKRKIIICITFVFSIFIFNIIMISCLVFIPFGYNSTSVFSFLVSAPITPSFGIHIFGVVMFALNSFAWMFPPILFILLCSILMSLFKQYNKTFCERIKRNNKECIDNIYQFRYAHLQLCKAVEMFDNHLKCFILFWYITNIPVGCFGLYAVIGSSLEPFTRIIVGFWVLLTFLYLIAPSIVAAVLKEEASIKMKGSQTRTLTSFWFSQSSLLTNSICPDFLRN